MEEEEEGKGGGGGEGRVKVVQRDIPYHINYLI